MSTKHHQYTTASDKRNRPKNYLPSVADHPYPRSSQSSIFFVVASVELRGEGPLGGAVSDAAWVAGSVYALRCALDIWLRAPLHWGSPFVGVGDLLSCSLRGGASRTKQALGKAARRPVEPPSSALATTPRATPAPPRPDI